ncbi:MAG: NADH:flavin oxidoreductase [bacterium]
MSEKYYSYKSLDDLRKECERLGVDITFEEKLESITRPVKLGDRTIGNAIGIHPMEGCDCTLDGQPDELTFRRWERFGRGGAKLIWGEATAILPEGLANSRQLLLNEENMSSIEALLSRSRCAHRDEFSTDSDLLIGLQLTHSGRYSYRKPIIAYHHPQVDCVTYIDRKKKIPIPPDYPVISDDELEKLEDLFVEAIVKVQKMGFDFVDIKQCHTYLLNELLGARTREGKYGGSFENRTRFIRNVLGKARNEVGSAFILASRINTYDGIPHEKDPVTGAGKPIAYPLPYPYNFGIDRNNPLLEDLAEPIQLVGIMREYGVLLINVSMGSPYYAMHLGRPFEHAPMDGYTTPEHPLLGIDRHFRITEQIQKAYPDVVTVGTGYSWLRQYLAYAGESNIRRGRVGIVAVGRGAIAYPDYAKDIIATGKMNSSKVCIAVSHCTNLMRSKHNEMGQYPAGCVPRDPIYAKIFKESLQEKIELATPALEKH